MPSIGFLFVNVNLVLGRIMHERPLLDTEFGLALLLVNLIMVCAAIGLKAWQPKHIKDSVLTGCFLVLIGFFSFSLFRYLVDGSTLKSLAVMNIVLLIVSLVQFCAIALLSYFLKAYIARRGAN